MSKKKPWEWVFRGYAYKTLADLARDFDQDPRKVWHRLNVSGRNLEEALGLKKWKKKGPRYRQVKVGDDFGHDFLQATTDGWMEKNKQMVMAICLRCNSGKPKKYQVGNLRDGHTKSCGCLSADMTSERKRIGVSKDDTSGYWRAIEDCRPVGHSSCRHVKCICTRCNDSIVHDKPVSQFLKTNSCLKCQRYQSVNVKHDVGKGDLFGDGRLCVIGEPFTKRTQLSSKRLVDVCCLSCGEGNIFTAVIQYLIDGVTTSCGCYHREQSSRAAVRDLWNNVKYLWFYCGANGTIYMRSRWELALAHVLDERDVCWEYEPGPFELANGTRYTPDFYLPEADEYIEVKGRQMPGWGKKKQLFEEEHGLTIVDKNNLKEWIGLTDYKIRQLYPQDVFRIHKSNLS